MTDTSSIKQEEGDPLVGPETVVVAPKSRKNKLKLDQLIYRTPHEMKNQFLGRQSRAVVANVASYMEMEKAYNDYLVSPKKARERTLMATGVQGCSLKRIVMESRMIQNKLQNDFKPAYVKREKKKAPSTCPEQYDTGACRSMIFKSILESRCSISTKQLYDKLVAAKLFKSSLGSLRRFLKNMGFQGKRTRNIPKANELGTRVIIMEEHDRQYRKFVYLRDLRKYRAEGRPIVYTAITKLARAHCKGGENQEMGQVLKVAEAMFADVVDEPRYEQWRAVLLGAGDERGFITGGFLIWRCIKKLGTTQYDEDANYKKYVGWVRENLLPNIPEGAAVVLENEPIYNKHADPIPTQSVEKEDMKKWLSKNGIDFSPGAAKVELYELVKQNKKYHSKYEIDSMLEKAGHPVLRIPLQYSELNPMMMMLKELKFWMKEQSPSANPRYVEVAKLTVSKMLSTPTDVWTSKVVTCQAFADEYFSYQAPMEEKIEKDILANNGCLDSASEDENDDEASVKDMDDSGSEDDKISEAGSSSVNPDMWTSPPPPRVFMAGDSIASTSAPEPKRCKPSGEIQSAKRQKRSANKTSLKTDEWELDGLVTIKDEAL